MSLKAVSVKVTSNSPARIGSVSYDNNINVKVDSQQNHEIKNFSAGTNRLRYLRDVQAFSAVDGDILVFNGVTGKYESKKISAQDITITNIDAGTF